MLNCRNVLSGVAIDKFLQIRGNVGQLQIAAMLDFAGDVFGDVLRPALCGVEGDDPDRVAVLASHQVGDDGLEVRGLSVGFPPNGAEPAEIVLHQVDCLIVAGWHDRGRGTHTQTPHGPIASTGRWFPIRRSASMSPAALHQHIGRQCLRFGRWPVSDLSGLV
jgi:hypothetical protein